MEDPGYGSGRLIFRAGRAHNPEVHGPNPCPATTYRRSESYWVPTFCVMPSHRLRRLTMASIVQPTERNATATALGMTMLIPV